MQDAMQEKVLELVERLEGVAPEVWAIVLRQQYIEAGLNIVFAVACAFGVWWIVQQRDKDWASDRTMGVSFPYFLAGLAALGALIFAAVGIWEGVAHLLNPEFYAIQELMP